MKSIDRQALEADAKKALKRMARGMLHPAVDELSWTTNDADRITQAVDALKAIKEPTNHVQRILNERATALVENGLFWANQMYERNGFQAAKGEAWKT